MSNRQNGVVAPTSAAAAELYWIPLGAGSPVVRASGRIFETISARRHRRPRGDLYHAALVVKLPSGQFTIEQAPVPDENGGSRGVVAVGPVGHRWAGRWRIFRYEVRCWRDGIIPDIGEAVDSPVCLTTDTDVASLIVELLPMVPTPVWGRDQASTGEMWNSNSVIAWVLTRSGVDTVELTPPSGGRAPGWAAGRAVAQARHLQAGWDLLPYSVCCGGAQDRGGAKTRGASDDIDGACSDRRNPARSRARPVGGDPR